jgi:mannosyltransferase
MTNDRIHIIYKKIQEHPASPYAVLAAITLLAAALRFYKLGEWSFWIDEIYTINRAMIHYSRPELILENIFPARYWIPVSTILTAQVINLAGMSEWTARLVSTLIGILSIPILYIPIKKIIGQPTALIAMLVLAVSPWHIFWSQNARFYTALMLFYTLALFVFYLGLERDKPHYFLAFYILFYFAMSERMIAGFLIPVVVLYLILLRVLPIEKPAGFRFRNIAIFSIPIILFLILQTYLFATTGVVIFGVDVEALPASIGSPPRLLIVIAFSIGIPMLILAFFSGIFTSLQKERSGILFFIGAVLPIILLGLTSPFVFTVERYAIVTLVFWIILAATGIKIMFSLAGNHALLFALAVFFILLGDSASEGLIYYQNNRGNRLDWREAVEYVQDRKQDGDVVVATRWELATHYLKEDVLDYQVLLPQDFEEIDRPIWFIMDFPGIWHGNHDSKLWMEEHATLLEYTFLRTREQNYLLIYHYYPEGQEP